MKPINLCVTTFNRQDLLPAMLRSAFAGSVTPDRVYVVVQADNKSEIMALAIDVPVPVIFVDLGEKRGCEASAINYYLTQVAEERVIAHDDVEFGLDSLRRFVETPGAFVIDDKQGVITYRDAAVEAVGLYDVEMSPNYYRYVDADYEERLAEAGIEPVVVNAGITHVVGGTMKAMQDLGEYHRRVGIANDNYERKWGRPLTPGASTIGRSEWRKANWPLRRRA